MKEKCIVLLKKRGVSLEDISECVLFLQKPYHPEISLEQVLISVDTIIGKREVQHAILTGVTLDQLAEQGKIPDCDLQSILEKDESLYGVDEVLAYGICNLYGSIALTNYGYIDRVKPGILAHLNDHNQAQCNTFLDDIVGAIAASAASRIAHQ